MRRSQRHAAGFTLLEIMIVLGLLLVLGSVAVMGFMQVKQKADRDATRVMVTGTAEAVNMYNATMNEYPDSESGLTALVERPQDEEVAEKWAGPYLKDGVPTDPWGSPIQYQRMEEGFGEEGESQPFRIWSFGPDKQDGTDDDIRNWEE